MCPEYRLYSLCRNMNWAHLPEPGGIYNQNPKLLSRFEIIMQAEAKEERRQQAEREAKSKRKSR